MKSRIRFCVEVMVWTVVTLWAQSFQEAAAQVPEENRKQLMEALGTPFIVYRDKFLDELKVSDEQREKLMQQAMEQIMETGPFLTPCPKPGRNVNKSSKNTGRMLGRSSRNT